MKLTKEGIDLLHPEDRELYKYLYEQSLDIPLISKKIKKKYQVIHFLKNRLDQKIMVINSMYPEMYPLIRRSLINKIGKRGTNIYMEFLKTFNNTTTANKIGISEITVRRVLSRVKLLAYEMDNPKISKFLKTSINKKSLLMRNETKEK